METLDHSTMAWTGDLKKNQDHLDYINCKIKEDTKKSPAEVKRRALIQNPVKNY